MSRTLALLGLLALSCLPARAQDNYPRFEIFGGYSLNRMDIASGFAFGSSAHGWAASFNANLHRSYGLTTDFSGHYGDRGIGGVCIAIFPPPPECLQRVNFSTHQFLFGPRLTLRRSHLTWFAHALAGVVQTRTAGFTEPGFTFGGVTVPPLTIPPRTDADFAMGLGTGLDFNVDDRLAIRIIQADYVPVRGANFFWLDNLRLRFGVVLKLRGR